MNQIKWIGLGAALAGAVAGCVPAPPDAASSPPVPAVQTREFKPNVDAGVPVPAPGPLELAKLIAPARRYAYHGNPAKAFDLRPAERVFEQEQGTERYLQTAGGFSTFYEPPADTVVLPVVEPQPYRRLSGIVVGDSVVALIEMENGQTVLIRPGSKIPNTEWTVVSIDTEKAVLRRPGNRLPRQIVVRLETSPFPVQNTNPGTTGGFPGGPPGGPPGGFPGGPPGGFPGGPPGGFPGGPGGGGRGDD